jgi:hypothetical protein
MLNTTGLTGAAPIWSAFMKEAVPYLTHDNPTPFRRPGGIVDKVICAVSGTEPAEGCPETRSEIFASDQLPKPSSKDFYANVTIDTWTGLLASGECQEFQKSIHALSVDDSWGRKWLTDTDQGRDWLASEGLAGSARFVPERECRSSDPRPEVSFAGMEDNQTITTNPVDVYGLVNVSEGFKNFELFYGLGDEPSEWKTLAGPFDSPRAVPDRLVTWDATEFAGNMVTLRIVLNGTDGQYADKRIRLILNIPQATATPLPTATATLVPTITPVPTEQPTATILPTETVQPPTAEPLITLP